MAWDDGATKEEYADEQGEARKAVRRGDEDYDFTRRSRHADGPYHFAELSRMEGYEERW